MMRTNRSGWRAAVVVLALAPVVSCGSDSEESGSAPSAAGTAASVSSAPTTEQSRVHSESACLLSTQELGSLVAPLYTGPVEIEIDNYGDGYIDGRCHYLLDGSSGGAGFEITAQRYSDNVVFTTSSSSFEFDYGGSSPEQVVSSSAAAFEGQLNPGSDGFASYPDIGAGMVTNERSQLILAGTGEYWYAGTVSGVSLSANQANNDVLVAVGTAMAAATR